MRDLERQANIQAGIETEEDNRSAGLRSSEEITFSSIARALANRYDSIYYVNIVTNHYVEYVSSSEYQDLKVETSGNDFFEDSRRNILRVVHEEDKELALAIHRKDYLLKELEKEPVLAVTYRLMFDGTPHYYQGRFTKGGIFDEDHLIVGWANVDSQIRREEEFEQAKKESARIASINSALTSDYVKVYYVDLETESYTEFTPREGHEGLHESGTGKYFFADLQREGLRTVYSQDQAKFSSSFEKEAVISALEEGPFAVTYRRMENGAPVYFSMKVVYADNHEQVLFGLRNIDAQMKRENEYESRLHSMSTMVNTDALTGVKNRNAFAQEELKLDQAIEEGEIEFSIVVCDVNGLKTVNDSQGHKAGDKLIRDTSAIICDIFKRSPVFRIGGDEFAIVLQGKDYQHRQELMRELSETVRKNQEEGGVVFAAGISDYQPGEDQNCEVVFERADTQMYEDKKELKL